MQIIPLGDSALIIRLDCDFRSAPASALDAVRNAAASLHAAAIPGVIECAPAYDSVGVFLDVTKAVDAGAPADAVSDWFRERITAALSDSLEDSASPALPRVVEIPVCYDEEFALDLEHVSRHTGLPAADVIRLHATPEYIVSCVGFMPGFPYLAGLSPELQTPRRETPRKEVPAGSVAIGGMQTGIYPATSPGGWHVIGRTPVQLFNAQNETAPSLLRAGDRVRFRSITRAEFKQAAVGTSG